MTKKTFDDWDSPMDDTTPAEIGKATKTGKFVGQFQQKTLRLYPEMFAAMDRIAAKEGISKADATRWVVARGLQAYFADDERPEKVELVARNVVMPWMGS